MVPATEGAALEVGQAQGLLHLPVVVSNPPAEIGRSHQSAAWEARFAQALECLESAERDEAVDRLRQLLADPVLRQQPGQGAVTRNTFHGPAAIQTGPNSRQENHFGQTR